MAGVRVSRWMVLHADDFGMNKAVNAGILQSFRDGILTSTSLLANAPAAEEACQEWPRLMADLRAESISSTVRRRKLSDHLTPFDLGIHLNLTQGHPLSAGYPSELLNEKGEFPGIGPVFRHLRSPRSRFREVIQKELEFQIERMCEFGVVPTHLNGHQYVEMMPAVATLVPSLMEKYSIPVVRVAYETHLVRTVLMEGRAAPFAVALVKRHFARRFRRQNRFAAPARFFGTAHAGLVSRSRFESFVRFSSPHNCTEIGLHPASVPQQDASGPHDPWFDPLANLRPEELAWLCDESTPDILVSHHQSLGRLHQIPSSDSQAT